MTDMDFLNKLPLTDIEKEKLNLLEIGGPAEMYNLIADTIKTDHSFENFFGSERTYHLIRFLWPLLSDEEQAHAKESFNSK